MQPPNPDGTALAEGALSSEAATPLMNAAMCGHLAMVELGLGCIVALYHLLIHFIPDLLTYSVALF